MTRTPSGARWRAASAALALCGLLAAGATPALAADDPTQLRLPTPSAESTDSSAASDDPLKLLRADPREHSAPVRHDDDFAARVAAATGTISGKVTYTDMTTGPEWPARHRPCRSAGLG